MTYPSDTNVTVFDAGVRVAAGPLADAVTQSFRYLARAPQAELAVYADATGERLELDWAAGEEALLAQALAPATPPAGEAPLDEARRGPGRPRLGVVAREVTLLPRHWEWLNTQPGGASATLRRLIDEARRAQEAREAARRMQEAAYRFMQAAGGDLPGLEEALRALYAGDAAGVEAQLSSWPIDLRQHVLELAFGPRRPSS